MKQYHIFEIIFVLVIMLFLMTGCGKNVQVTGTVTFSDGTPLTKGMVVFQSETVVAKGNLNDSGQYRLGSLKKSDGLPAGSYKVYVSGAGAIPKDFVAPPGSDESGYVPWVDFLFASAETTPISCDVSGSQTFDFQVEPYKEKVKNKNKK